MSPNISINKSQYDSPDKSRNYRRTDLEADSIDSDQTDEKMLTDTKINPRVKHTYLTLEQLNNKAPSNGKRSQSNSASDDYQMFKSQSQVK